VIPGMIRIVKDGRLFFITVDEKENIQPDEDWLKNAKEIKVK